jgi:hypothetical protein
MALARWDDSFRRQKQKAINLKIACTGSGRVGGVLADGLQKLGHETEESTNLRVRNVGQDGNAEVVFLARPFRANETALEAVSGELDGKILVELRQSPWRRTSTMPLTTVNLVPKVPLRPSLGHNFLSFGLDFSMPHLVFSFMHGRLHRARANTQ